MKKKRRKKKSACEKCSKTNFVREEPVSEELDEQDEPTEEEEETGTNEPEYNPKDENFEEHGHKEEEPPRED